MKAPRLANPAEKTILNAFVDWQKKVSGKTPAELEKMGLQKRVLDADPIHGWEKGGMIFSDHEVLHEPSKRKPRYPDEPQRDNIVILRKGATFTEGKVQPALWVKKDTKSRDWSVNTANSVISADGTVTPIPNQLLLSKEYKGTGNGHYLVFKKTKNNWKQIEDEWD